MTKDTSRKTEVTQQRVDVGLSGVQETMLWTLHNRVGHASRPRGISLIHDPKACEIYKSINYDFQRSFGRADASNAIRSFLFDQYILDFWDRHPGGTVLNLGEGLETQRFRLEEKRGDALWVTVDLPNAVEAREKFIAPDENHLHVAVSALDVDAWAKVVPKDKPIFITAQGLFMYLEEQALQQMFQDIALQFPGASMMFDAFSKLVSKHSLKGWRKTKHYTAPKMPFGVNRFDGPPLFESWVNGLKAKEVPLPTEKFPVLWRASISFFDCVPIIRGYMLATVFRVDFPDRT